MCFAAAVRPQQVRRLRRTPSTAVLTSWRGGMATVILPLAKKDVTALLETTSESFSRSMRSLSDKGLIAIGSGRSVSITDPDRKPQAADKV